MDTFALAICAFIAATRIFPFETNAQIGQEVSLRCVAAQAVVSPSRVQIVRLGAACAVSARCCVCLGGRVAAQ